MKKILAADDDPGMRALYQVLLAEEGFEVEIAEDAASALEKFMSWKPDILVLDVDMPGGGGPRVFTITRRILQLGVPVVFVTGFPESVVDSALMHEKVVILQKPLDEAKLMAEIHRLTD